MSSSIDDLREFRCEQATVFTQGLEMPPQVQSQQTTIARITRRIPNRSCSADYRLTLNGVDETQDVVLGIKKNGLPGAVKLELRVGEKEERETEAKDDHMGRGNNKDTTSSRFDRMMTPSSATTKISMTHTGSKLDLQRRTALLRSRSASKMTLDELLESHHNHKSQRHRNRHRRRRYPGFTDRGARGRRELRKSLSYGQMQDLTDTFHSMDILDLKQSLHRIQHKRRTNDTTCTASPKLAMAADPSAATLASTTLLQETAKKLADLFIAALFAKSLGSQPEGSSLDSPSNGCSATTSSSVIQEQVRGSVMNLTVDEMLDIIQQLETWQTTNAPIQWQDIQSTIDPHRKIDWDNGIFIHGQQQPCAAKKIASLHSIVPAAVPSHENNNNKFGESSCWESYETLTNNQQPGVNSCWESYETLAYESSSCSSSFLRSDDGSCGAAVDLNDDDDENSGYCLETYTDHCDSSVTIDWWSTYDDDDSFAGDDQEKDIQIQLQIEEDEEEVEVVENGENDVYEEIEEEIVDETEVEVEEEVDDGGSDNDDYEEFDVEEEEEN